MSGDGVNSDRAELVERVVAECLRRRMAGETIGDDAVIAEHPDLMPELGEMLRKLAVIEDRPDGTVIRWTSQGGDGPTLIPRITCAVNRGQSSRSSTVTENCSAAGGPAGFILVSGSLSSRPVRAAISRAIPTWLMQSPRL